MVFSCVDIDIYVIYCGKIDSFAEALESAEKIAPNARRIMVTNSPLLLYLL